MQLLGGLLMEKRMVGRHSLNGGSSFLRAVGIAVLFALTLSGTALGQQIPVTGTVTSTVGAPIQGVTVRVQGTDIRAVTNATGKYFLNVPADATLTFSFVGQKPIQEVVAGRNTINVTMAQIPYLEEVVVTAYTSQRRADITGAVSSVNVESMQRASGASVLQRLDAAVPGVAVANSGSPGSRSSIRVRGVSSFQNNEPLYVVDGTPVDDSYMNFLNPDDITSIQVLKDASAASIYGSRAGNGVIVIETTKKGMSGPPQVTFRARTGIASPVRGYDDFLITDALDYFQVIKASNLNAGLPVPTNVYGDPNNPTVPKYIYPLACPAGTGCSAAVTAYDAWGRPTAVNAAVYSYPSVLIMPGSTGTNWWKAVFGSAPVSDYNLDIAGGSSDNAYRVSFNYFDQKGTAVFNDYRRGSVRANTSFNRSLMNFGENVVVALDRSYGGMGDPTGYAEDGIMGKNILMEPVIPVYDIAGNYAGPKAMALNQSNPVAYAFQHKNDVNKNVRIFGNVFAGIEPIAQVNLKSSLGFNVGQNSFAGYAPITPENAEPNLVNSINENNNQFTNWTWSNTLAWDRKGNSRHNFSLLLGQAAGAGTNRFITASMANLLNSALDSRYIQDALGDASTKNVSSSGGRYAELSFFGKADYNFADKYVASFTMRKDGSSRLGPTHRWGTFPAFGLGWRLSNESFMANNRIFSDVMLRYGYGVTGNQNIPAGRIVSQFGGSRGDTYYDITGSNTSVVAGFRQASLGNPDLKWEENRSSNVGTDLVLFNGMLNVVLDVYRRNTNNLLFNPATPATQGIASPPIVNIGKMRNTGFDFSIGHASASWNATFNGSHYSNKIISIDGKQNFFYGPVTTRFGNQVINQVGSPIGSFYGKVFDGYFTDAADAKAHTAAGNCGPVSATNPLGTGIFCQAGAEMGRIKFKDVNGDGIINSNDRTIIGNPHPKFTAGLDLGARRGNFDLSATFFGSFGNDIFENQKEFYVFREFGTNVKNDLLANSWTPTNQNAKYPRLNANDGTSSDISSYYIESGTYVRLRNVQLGYNVPSSMARWISAARVYLQADNLFTKTNYEGLDPALPAPEIFGSAGDIRDQYLGVDRGAYPSNRIFSIGVVTSF
jgi:TonB-dependent starch-binding outer membrane protein SusC